MIALVHLACRRFRGDGCCLTSRPGCRRWHPVRVMVITTTASDSSSSFARAKGTVMDNCACGLHLARLDHRSRRCPAPDRRRHADRGDCSAKAPFAVGAFLALFGEQIELHDCSTDEPEPSPAMRALIGRVIDQQVTEREAFIAALRVYKEETARLTADVAESRRELSAPDRSGPRGAGTPHRGIPGPRRPPRVQGLDIGLSVMRANWPRRTCSSERRSASRGLCRTGRQRAERG